MYTVDLISIFLLTLFHHQSVHNVVYNIEGLESGSRITFTIFWILDLVGVHFSSQQHCSLRTPTDHPPVQAFVWFRTRSLTILLFLPFAFSTSSSSVSRSRTINVGCFNDTVFGLDHNDDTRILHVHFSSIKSFGLACARYTILLCTIDVVCTTKTQSFD